MDWNAGSPKLTHLQRAAIALPTVNLVEKGKILGTVSINAISSVYTLALITAWCCGILFLFLKDANNDSLVPLLIWSYRVATGPWAYFASKEQGPDGKGFASLVSATFAQLAYIVIMVIICCTPITFLSVIKVFGGFMLVDFLISTVVAYMLLKEHKRVMEESAAFFE
ncbi:MAG: hypothetical protein HZA51_09920 [Planctomycetes bacterium]|nr:hypothetical protein [Planctomycetota bacterium]